MTPPNPDDFYRTLMRRSWRNYEYIKEQYGKGQKVHDVTQLVATLLVAVCYPIEREIGAAFRHLQISEAEARFGLPKLPEMDFTPRQQQVPGLFNEADLASNPDILTANDISRDFDPKIYLGDYLEILRHAIAHGHLAYFARKNPHQVDTIEFRNIRKSGVNDCVELSIEIVEQLIRTCITISEQRYSSLDQLRSILTQ